MTSLYVNIFFAFCLLKPLVHGSSSINGGYPASVGWPNPQQQYGVSGICPQNTECLPSSSCQSYSDALNNRGTYYSGRSNYINCGYEGSGFICCPLGRNYNRPCGSTLVEAQNYLGIGTFPFVARIGFKDTETHEIRYPCSGSIIGERIILTAAHCALAKVRNFKLYTVRVGEFDSSRQLDCGFEFCALPLQDITVSHVIVHPGYQQQLFKDDVALLVLNARINYTVTAQPVCLPEKWANTGTYATLVGWGQMAGQTEEFPRQQALQLPIVNIQQCISVYRDTLPVNENQLCVGGERGRDACSGFGGSPLLEKQGGSYFQVGILSFGAEQCGAQGVPSVYTNLKNYITWIKENIPVLYN